MAYSKNLAINPIGDDGLNGWTTTNVTIPSLQFILGPGPASMSQVRDVSTLDFNLQALKATFAFLTDSYQGAIVDFAYLKINYGYGFDILQIPLLGGELIVSEVELRDIVVSIEIGVSKPSNQTIAMDELSYYHKDNPFTYEEAEVDKPNNSIITDAYGIHVYDGNAFEGGVRRVTLGEYSLGEFGLLVKGKNAETVLNEYGINPKFLDYSKNLVWNSSFEVFDQDNKPLFWSIDGSGESTPNSSFYSSRSLRLGAGALARQSWAARVKPWWINNSIVRCSMYINGVQDIQVRVVDIGTWEQTGGIAQQYYDLDDGVNPTSTTLTYTGASGWEGSRITFTFDSSKFTSAQGTDEIAAFALEITNVDSGNVYIDGVMAHVDFTGQWAQLYKDGPRSISTQMIGDVWSDPAPGTSTESTAEVIIGIHVGDVAPTNTNLLWLDTTT